MSRLSKWIKGLSVVPGTPISDVISTTATEGNAALLLQFIGKTFQGSRTSRNFPKYWKNEDGVLSIQGSVHFGQERSLTLKIGTREGLLVENRKGKSCSWNHNNGDLVIEVGDETPQQRLETYAHEVVACWAVHGQRWRDRNGYVMPQPYGLARKYGVVEKMYFNVIDGSLGVDRPTLKELIDHECFRSVHVGNWYQRHSTLIAAMAGMPLVIHEFKEGGGKVCSIDAHLVSRDSKMWSGYCRWDESLRRSAPLGLWRELALQSASPFSFHVHATRMLFQKAELDSSFLLQRVGKEKLRGVLEIMLSEDPERFYRLIDEHGKTHRLGGVGDSFIVYGDYGRFDRNKIVDNVLCTFEELCMVQSDCTYVLERKPRVVMDTHAYIVIESLARRSKNVYAFSGSQMHSYLTKEDQGNSVSTHRVRNERLFLLLRQIFGMESVNFHVYPPVNWNSGVTSQYADLTSAPVQQWLSSHV